MKINEFFIHLSLKCKDKEKEIQQLKQQLEAIKHDKEQLRDRLEYEVKMIECAANDEIANLKQQLESCQSLLKEAVDVIGFYGNIDTYQNYGMGYLEPILNDREDKYSVSGLKARQFLAKYRSEYNK